MLQGFSRSPRAALLAILLTATPSALQAAEACSVAGGRLAAQAAGHSAALMKAPVFGELNLLEGEQPATKNLVLARQSITMQPQVRYLADPITLTDAGGKDMAKGVPLDRGAPITSWRDASGVKHCAIGWKNGLFGGLTGDGHVRWICFEDRNGDGALDNAWRPYSRNLGLSFQRLDLPLAKPAALLDAPPADTLAKGNPRTIFSARDLNRSVIVVKLTGKAVVLEDRVEQDGFRRRIERQELSLERPGEANFSGITITLVPGGEGAPRLRASGAFRPDSARLTCEGTQFAIGETSSRTEFAFPNW